MRREVKKKLYNILVCLILVGIGVWAVLTSNKGVKSVLTRLDYVIYDTRLKAALAGKKRPESSIGIIDIDERSLNIEGRWPWSRIKIAELVDKLRAAGVLVIAFDVVFAEEEQNIIDDITTRIKEKNVQNPVLFDELAKLRAEFDNDALLGKKVEGDDIVLGIFFHSNDMNNKGVLPITSVKNKIDTERLNIISLSSYISNIPAIEKTNAHTGFLTTFRDLDGVIRRTPLLVAHKDKVYPSLALEAARLFLLIDDLSLNTVDVGGTNIVESINMGKQKIPTDGLGQVIIPYRGPRGTFNYYSATDVLHGRVGKKELENKLVFIGGSAFGMSDLQTTPLHNVYPGVEIHANICAAIMDNKFPYTPDWAKGAELLTTVLVGIICTLLFPFLGPMWLSITGLFFLILIFGFDTWLWKTYWLILSFTVPMLMTIVMVLATMAYGFLFENKRGKILSSAFGQYVPPEHVKKITENPDNYGFEGESRELTVLFADIRGFTTISETLDAISLKKLLNLYFTPMTEIIFNNQGTIDKYVGDMIMAFWGAPITDEEHRRHGLNAALDMINMTEKLKVEFADNNLPIISIGIGLNTGNMNVGDMGSKFRRSYTVLGDAVNLGSRIEGTTKYYGVKIAVGEDTYKGQQENFVFRKLDRVKVKGKHTAIEIFECICRREDATAELFTELEKHEATLELYFKQEWDNAEAAFRALSEAHPDRGIYTLLLERIAFFRENPPGAEWDGSFERHEK